MIRFSIALAILSLLSSFAQAETIIGRASVIDGDTIEIRGERIGLYGIDAFESDQVCHGQGKTVPCGRIAAIMLDGLIGGKTVTCHTQDKDRYGRVLAICTVPNNFPPPSPPTDLGWFMVGQGFALAYRQYSERYIGVEEQAKRDRSGMWKGDFIPPWEYRASKRQ